MVPMFNVRWLGKGREKKRKIDIILNYKNNDRFNFYTNSLLAVKIEWEAEVANFA